MPAQQKLPHRETGAIFPEGKLKQALRPFVRLLRRMPGRMAMRLGRIGSGSPLSKMFGFDRGTPIDRLYIEEFLARHASDIQGHVLELADDGYSRRFGGDRVIRQDVLAIEPGHSSVTIIGDLADPEILPANTFDCIILTQTLHLVFDLAAAFRNLRSALRPGGVLLLTVPAIGPLCADQWKDSFYWSFTPLSVAKLLRASFDASKIEVTTYGNLYAATAFLHGAALEEVSRRKLDHFDPAYPVTVAARAVA